MNNIDDLIKYYNDLPEVKRIHELEEYIDKNQDIKVKLNELKSLQKKIVSSKEFNQLNQLAVYEDEYARLKEEILNIPFLEEYLELLDIVDVMLHNMAKKIEYRLDKELND